MKHINNNNNKINTKAGGAAVEMTVTAKAKTASPAIFHATLEKLLAAIRVELPQATENDFATLLNAKIIELDGQISKPERQRDLEEYKKTGLISNSFKKKVDKYEILKELKSNYEQLAAELNKDSGAAASSGDSTSACSLCFCPIDDVKPEELLCFCELKTTLLRTKTGYQHPRYHKDCMTLMIETAINGGYIGMCPQIYCPEATHISDLGVPLKQQVRIQYNDWSKLVTEKLLLKYQSFAEAYMLFLCGSCHTSKSQLLPFDPNLVQKTDGLDKFLKSPKANFLKALAQYQSGSMTLNAFYAELFTVHAPDLKLKDDYAVWEFVKIVIAMISDPERRSALQLRHWNDRPRFKTLCCQKEHCFKCKTKEFHTGKSCTENIGAMDSSVLPCPTCNLFLAKSDGCDSVTCACGHKFSWTPALSLYKAVQKFATEFPNETAAKCADFLCGILEGIAAQNKSRVVDSAVNWRNFNRSLVDRLTLAAWEKRFPGASNQMMAKCMMDNNTMLKMELHISVVTNWNAVHKTAVDRATQSIKHSNAVFIDSLFPSSTEKYLALTTLNSIPKADRTSSESDIVKKLLEYKNANEKVWAKEQERAMLQSAHQFVHMYGNQSANTKYNLEDAKAAGEPLEVHMWHRDWCNTGLEFSDAGLGAKRPGGQSSYPAAFSKVKGLHDRFQVRLVEAGSTTNSMSFGVCTLQASGNPSLNTSGSDGFGRTTNTYGIIEDRGNNDPLKVYRNREVQNSWGRKLRVGDVLTAAIDLENFTLQVSLNENEFSDTILLPNGSYCFGMTFANDHKVIILNDNLDDFTYETASVASAADADNASELPQGVHEGIMTCKCGHRSGQERFPLDASRYHLEECAWSCCNQPWMTKICPVASKSKTKPTTTSAAAAAAAAAIPGAQLNRSHSKMFSDYTRLLGLIKKQGIDSKNWQSKFGEKLKAMILEKGQRRLSSKKGFSPDDISIAITDLASKRATTSPVNETWAGLLEGACAYVLDRDAIEKALAKKQAAEAKATEARERAMDGDRATCFMAMHGDNCGWMAAHVLVPDRKGFDADEIKMAQAFARVNPTMMNEWYDYNATLSESLIPELQRTPKSCRCIPRCTKAPFNCGSSNSSGTSGSGTSSSGKQCPCTGKHNNSQCHGAGGCALGCTIRGVHSPGSSGHP